MKQKRNPILSTGTAETAATMMEILQTHPKEPLEETIGESTSRNKEWFDKGYAQALKHVESIVKQMKVSEKPLGTPSIPEEVIARDHGYNTALFDLLTKLKEDL